MLKNIPSPKIINLNAEMHRKQLVVYALERDIARSYEDIQSIKTTVEYLQESISKLRKEKNKMNPKTRQ